MELIDEAEAEANLAESRDVPPQHATKAIVDAMAAFDPGKHLLPARQILERRGEASHEIGHFEGSFVAYADALMASDYLLAATADPRHRSAEIFQSRGDALFAAYAAARLGNAEDAVAIAERGRMRLHGDLLDARELHDRLTELRSRLEPVEEEGDAALGAVLAHPAFASEGAPYTAPDFWGPVIFKGPAGSPSTVGMGAADRAGETAG